SYREEIESDLDDDVQDDEDLLSQPLQGSSQLSPLDIATQAASTSSLAHLNNFMNMHPQLLAKLKMQYSEADVLQSRNGLEALQAAMSSANFNVPLFPPIYLSPPPPPQLPQQQQQHQHPQNNNSQAVASSLGNAVENQLMMTSASVRPPAASSQTGESPQRGCRNNNNEPSQANRNNGESRECESRASASANNQHPSGSGNWNFEEQFRQVRQASNLANTYVFLGFSGIIITRLARY
ncbi:protein dead ringer-like protein, partial [Lasius niger]